MAIYDAEDVTEDQRQYDVDKKDTQSSSGTMSPPLEETDSNTQIKAEAGAEGVARVEAFTKLLRQSKNGRAMLWLLGLSLLLTMFAYALDQGLTTSIFATSATSFFSRHSEIAAINVASQ